MRPVGRLIAWLTLMGAIFAAGYWWGRETAPLREPPQVPGLLWPAGPQLQPFELRDDAGAAFTQASLQGHWTLLFFGFTHCPDICPTTLATLKQAYAALQDSQSLARRLQVVFVSVDAERDTPEVLARYVGYFNPKFRGVTGPMERLHLLTRQLGADYARVSAGKDGEYWFDHSASVFLVAPDLRVAAAFDPPFEAGALAAQTRAVHEFLE